MFSNGDAMAGKADDTTGGGAVPGDPARKDLTPAARRALAEAEARRAERDARVAAMPRELGGRGGEEPVRYGDWEHKGLTSDF